MPSKLPRNKGKASGGNKTRLDFNLPSKMESWTFTISGNAGSKVITADIAKDNLDALCYSYKRRDCLKLRFLQKRMLPLVI